MTERRLINIFRAYHLHTQNARLRMMLRATAVTIDGLIKRPSSALKRLIRLTMRTLTFRFYKRFHKYNWWRLQSPQCFHNRIVAP